MQTVIDLALAAGLSVRWAAAAEYFVLDSIKIVLLLFVMVAVVATLRTWLPQERIRQWLGGHPLLAHPAAALFGAVTPFCSCSSIPLFLGFLKMGIPLGVSFSFLITSPIINEYLVLLMLVSFGWKITTIYVVSGIVIGVAAGMVLGRMGLERHLEKDILKARTTVERFASFKARLVHGVKEAGTMVRKLWLWIIAGVGLGAVIHNLVPETALEAIGKSAFSVPLATLIGVPMYANCVAIVPIAVALFQKGAPLGTALAFMMATAALSLPEAIILRRAMKLRLILLFFGIVAAAIVFTGYLINAVQPLLV